jgi:putative NADPH-quinone reductase
MRVLIVFDHPYGAAASDNIPHHRSFSAALLKATLAGLETAGHHADLIDLHADGFDPVMSARALTELRLRATSDPIVLDYQARLGAADHVIFIYPTWWMSMPAGTKGFLDRVLNPGFAYEEVRPGRPLTRLLHRLSGVTVLTPMTTPGWLYSTWFAGPAQRILFRGTFGLIGIPHLRFHGFSAPAQRSAAHRERSLKYTERLFARL